MSRSGHRFWRNVYLREAREMDESLTRYDAACRAVAEARNIDDVCEIMNKTAALKEYYRRAKNRQLVIDAIEILARSQRRLGEMLDELVEKGQLSEGRPWPKNNNCADEEQLPRVVLDDLEISRKLSAASRRLSCLPQERFERLVGQWRQKALEEEKIVAFDPFAKNRERAERRAAREEALGRLQLTLPRKKYGVIVADPEWRFEPWGRETGMAKAADNHYCTSQLDVIKSRNVPSIAADDCALFLWATQPMLPQALEVLDAWGFAYKSHWIWAKDRIGPGYWSRNKHEVLLLGVHGDVPCPAPGEQWDSLLEAPRKGHSEKPEIFLEMVETYFPTLPKIELNRRGEARKGWHAWGDQAVAAAG